MVPKQQGYAIQGNDWPSGTNERGRHDQVPFDEPYGREYLQWGSRVGFKSARRLHGYTHAI
jgi:hypothetical protein